MSENQPGEFEPDFNYDTLGGSAAKAASHQEQQSIASIIKSDKISTICVREKLMALGTQGGRIYVLDLEGNIIKFPSGEIGVKAHQQPVCLFLPVFSR